MGTQIRGDLASFGGRGLPGRWTQHETSLAGAEWTAAAPDDESSPLERDLAQHWRTLMRRRWLILAVVCVALAVGAAVTLLTQPVYTAEASLQLDREPAKVINTQDPTPSDELVSGDEFFQTQYALLRSRSLAERVAQALGLDQSDAFIRKMGARPGRDDRSDQVIKLLSSNLAVIPTRGSRLVTVAFSSPDPVLSAQIANAFSDNFITSNLDRRMQASSYAKDFLERQLALVKAKLETSERDLVAYAEAQHIIDLPQQNGATPTDPSERQSLASASLEDLNTALAAAQTDRIKAEEQWRQAQSTPGLGLPDVQQSATVQQLERDRSQLSADYQNKLQLFKPSYPDMVQLKAQIDEIDRQLALQANTIRNSLKSQYLASLKSEQALQGRVDALKSSVLDLRERSIEYNILQREVDTNRTLYDGLLQRYKEVGVAGGITTNNISVVDRADPPQHPSRPRPLVNLGVAAVAGLVLGVLMAFLREAFDQGIRAPADVETKLGLPFLGAVPMLERGVQPREALTDPKSPMAEAYQSLRSALQFSTRDGFPKSLLVTSTRQGEGKSTTAYVLAEQLARLGYRSLLIDADLRNPSLHKNTGADNRTGLSNLLVGAVRLNEAVQLTDLPGFFVITAGPIPPNPAELLAGPRLPELVAEASAMFDMVILDGPPVMGLADSPAIGAVAGGSLLVVEAGRVGRTQVRAAIRRLMTANGHLLGVALTKLDPKQVSSGYGYGYEYDYSYGKPGAADEPKSALGWVSARARKLISRA